MEQLTTYRAKGKEIGLVFLFKYDLNGNLRVFIIEEGELNAKQMQWLFASANFPANESLIRSVWMKEEKYTKVFEIEKSPAVLTFEALWELFGHKIKKFEAENKFKKLKEADVIKCFTSLPNYKKYLQRKGVAQTNLATYIHQRYFEDDWSKA
jgi:hypothetical protein